MSTYELDDDLVRVWIRDLREGLGDEGSKRLADSLEEQMPIPVPTKIGAVVRTERGIGVLADVSDHEGNARWVVSQEDGSGYKWETDSSLGRITAILSKGVDL